MLITREFGFDMGHCLPDHEGACFRPHGHRYRLEVTIEGEKIIDGSQRAMVMDFGLLKGWVQTVVIDWLDHRFAMCRDDERLPDVILAFGREQIVILDLPPTAETLVEQIADKLDKIGLPLVEVTLWETPTCRATWHR